MSCFRFCDCFASFASLRPNFAFAWAPCRQVTNSECSRHQVCVLSARLVTNPLRLPADLHSIIHINDCSIKRNDCDLLVAAMWLARVARFYLPDSLYPAFPFRISNLSEIIGFVIGAALLIRVGKMWPSSALSDVGNVGFKRRRLF